ncbi:HD domain-containing phosphohydrolase [Devosia aquimaris]|uniref:HD domain-containing phosphohydrolase n=1 Tax=Devosia aquimaris TaxID=2866214 RepID=UPI001CD13012|nr:HD domain-containing phosphohydrolase [Devosia sp. CJK-A8-3]
MRIVIVEDSSSNLAVLCRMVGHINTSLQNDHVECVGFTDPLKAIDYLQESACDLVITDYLMPSVTGLELIQMLRGMPAHQHVPVVIVTADADRARRMEAIRAGATDFLTKPVDPIELRLRVANLLELRRAQNVIARHADDLAEQVRIATQHLARREEEVVFRLARAIELRDGDTGGHVDRVAESSRIIAETMGLDSGFCRTLALASPLHDVGKIGVPDAILNKPGRLDDAERSVMQKHTTIGAEILAHADSDLVQMAAAIANSHHERWDGTGYPHRVAGANIPLAARITSVADVFDALISERCYKKAWSLEEARAEILRGAGTQFDPTCVAAFEKSWDKIVALMARDYASSNKSAA